MAVLVSRMEQRSTASIAQQDDLCSYIEPLGIPAMCSYDELLRVIACPYIHVVCDREGRWRGPQS